MGIFTYLIAIAIGIFAQKIRGRNGLAWGAGTLAIISLGHAYIQLAGGSEWMWTIIVSIASMLLLVGLKPGGSMVSGAVECPFCAEKVSVKAKLCKHCGKNLPANVVATQAVVDTPPSVVTTTIQAKPSVEAKPSSSWLRKNAGEFAAVAIFLLVIAGANGKLGNVFGVVETHGENNAPTLQQSFPDLLTSGAWTCGKADYSYEAMYFPDGSLIHYIRPEPGVEILVGGTWRVEGQTLSMRLNLDRFIASPMGATNWNVSAKGPTAPRSNFKTVVSTYSIDGQDVTLEALQWINWDGSDVVDFKSSEAKPDRCHLTAGISERLQQARSSIPEVLLPALPASQQVSTSPVKPPTASPAAGLPRFLPNEGYASVRQKLLASGWEPFHTADADVCSAGDARCQGRPEMQACAGTGMANCRFLWQRDGRTIAVMTVGEDVAYAGIEQVGGVATSANYDGIVVAPREQGEQYALRMTTPKVLAGDADCGQQQKNEIELWDQPSKLQPYVGKSVSVVGQLDCPRGGYVLRSVTISAR